MVPSLAFGDGGDLFDDHCSACHGPAGIGTPGFAPPVNRSEFWQELGDEAPTYLGGIMAAGLTGTITANGETYSGLMMPPQSALDPAELAEIGAYILTELGGLDVPFTEDIVLSARENPVGHAGLRAMRPSE